MNEQGFTEAMRRAADEMTAAERATRGLSASLGQGLRRSIEDAVFGARSLGEALRGMGMGLARDALRQALAPAQSAVGQGVAGLLAGAAGAALGGSGLRAFAKGGVVDGATVFPMAEGAGLMGEAGPEAILPLSRGPDGRLGVSGGGGVSVTINIQTADAESFRRSAPQVAAAMARAVARGRRGL
jgi:phage-related minor tail protein